MAHTWHVRPCLGITTIFQVYTMRVVCAHLCVTGNMHIIIQSMLAYWWVTACISEWISACMWIWVWKLVCTSLWTYAWLLLRVCVCVCVFACECVRMCVCGENAELEISIKQLICCLSHHTHHTLYTRHTQTHTHTHTHTDTYMFNLLNARTHIHSHTSTYTNTYTHPHTHIHTEGGAELRTYKVILHLKFRFSRKFYTCMYVPLDISISEYLTYKYAGVWSGIVLRAMGEPFCVSWCWQCVRGLCHML